jgi:repressor LexA
MQPKKKLSARQERMMEVIRDFMRENGLPPTVRDIQKACGISSTSVVDYNLRILQREGYLGRKPDVARGIELAGAGGLGVSHEPAVIRIPVVAYIAAGEPLPVLDDGGWAAGEPMDTIELPPEMQRNKGPLYALRVRGTSMIDALVDDGDVVVVEPTRAAANGEMVVARLKLENETTLKRFYLEGEQVRLQPANSTMEPIMSAADNVEVQGKVVGIIRMLP